MNINVLSMANEMIFRLKISITYKMAVANKTYQIITIYNLTMLTSSLISIISTVELMFSLLTPKCFKPFI